MIRAGRIRPTRVSALILTIGLLGACGGGGGGGGGGTPPTQPPLPPTGATFTPDSAAGPNSISLAAGSGGSATIFVLDVRATDVSDVYAVSFELRFPDNLLNFRKSGTDEGGFLNAGNADTDLIIEKTSNGTLVIGYSRLSPDNGASGSGLLFSLEFTLESNGSGSFDPRRTDVLDPFGVPQNGVDWIGGSISVSVN